MSLLRVDHVQITAPRAREREARHFYASVLGLRELERPLTIPASGLWFALDEMTELHVVFADDLEAVKRRLADHNVRYNPSPVQAGCERIFVQDPFGNRIEFLALAREGALK